MNKAYLIGGAMVLALLAGGVTWFASAERAAGADAVRRVYADSVAAQLRRTADSVRTMAEAQADSGHRADSLRVATRDHALAQQQRQTNVALEASQSALANALKVLADTAATTTTLRNALQQDDAAIDSLTAAVASERLASTAARKTRDSTYEAQTQQLRANFARSAKADTDSYNGLHQNMIVQVREAGDAGKRAGRVQGGGLVLLGDAIVVVGYITLKSLLKK